MRYMGLILIVLIVLSASLPAQTSKESPKKNAVADPEREQLREQVYETVKSVWADARNISDVRQRGDIYARSFRLLWKREPEAARSELIKNFNDLVDIYSATGKNKKDSDAIETTINKIISALAEKDSAAGQKVQQRFFEARRQLNGGTVDDRRDAADTLDLATDLLDSDVAQSVQLASRVFEKAFPEIAIQYLFDLQRKDPASAQRLYQNVLLLIASGQHYSPRSVITLSVYAFNETQSVFPGVGKGADGKPSVFLMVSATTYEPPQNALDRTSANAFIAAAYQYLRVRTLQSGIDDRSDLAAFCSYYFLVQKVKAYAQVYSLDPENGWLRYETAVSGYARQAGATESDLAQLVQQAQKVSLRKSLQPDSDDDTALSRATEEKDAKKKATLQVAGIMRLLRQKQFAKAEQSLDLLEDLAVRNQMSQIVRASVAKDAIATRQWDSLAQKIAKVDDQAMKVYLCLEAVRTIGDGKTNRDFALNFLGEAKKTLETMDNGIQKAAGVIATLALTESIDSASADYLLNDISRTINGAEKYSGERYFAFLTLPPNQREFAYQLNELDFEECFARSGNRNWMRTDLAARNLQNKYLQSWARLAAAKAFLGGKLS